MSIIDGVTLKNIPLASAANRRQNVHEAIKSAHQSGGTGDKGGRTCLWQSLPARHIFIAVTRYLAAHSPTGCSAPEAANIARRLMLSEFHRDAGTP